MHEICINSVLFYVIFQQNNSAIKFRANIFVCRYFRSCDAMIPLAWVGVIILLYKYKCTVNTIRCKWFMLYVSDIRFAGEYKFGCRFISFYLWSKVTWVRFQALSYDLRNQYTFWASISHCQRSGACDMWYKHCRMIFNIRLTMFCQIIVFLFKKIEMPIIVCWFVLTIRVAYGRWGVSVYPPLSFLFKKLVHKSSTMYVMWENHQVPMNSPPPTTPLPPHRT